MVYYNNMLPPLAIAPLLSAITQLMRGEATRRQTERERESDERTTGRNTMHIHNKLDKLDGQEADVGVVGEVSNR